jgi:hypothetical protein
MEAEAEAEAEVDTTGVGVGTGIESTASTTDFTVCASGIPSNSATASHFEHPGVAVLARVCEGIARAGNKASASANSMLAAYSEVSDTAIASSPVSANT